MYGLFILLHELFNLHHGNDVRLFVAIALWRRELGWVVVDNMPLFNGVAACQGMMGPLNK